MSSFFCAGGRDCCVGSSLAVRAREVGSVLACANSDAFDFLPHNETSVNRAAHCEEEQSQSVASIVGTEEAQGIDYIAS